MNGYELQREGVVAIRSPRNLSRAHRLVCLLLGVLRRLPELSVRRWMVPVPRAVALVTAGIAAATDLAGYTSGPVYIRRSMHVPPPREAVRDCMPALFDLLKTEPEPAVRVVLGHFVFVYIHPYIDGNGRMGRFLMNAMLASGGYPWTVIPVDRRDDYMAALEAASVRQDIGPCAALVSELVHDAIAGKPTAPIPGTAPR